MDSTLEETTLNREIAVYRDEILARNVDRGAELLDTVLPGWYNAINIDRLDLGSASGWNGVGCILCQLDHFFEDDERLPRDGILPEDFGSYGNGWDALLNKAEDVSYELSGDFGFDLYEENTDEYKPALKSHVEYHLLDVLWKKEIEDRK